MIWDALLEFLFRLAFGLSVGMLLTPSSQVPAGFFRVHLWVLLGMYTLAALFGTSCNLPPTSKSAVVCISIITAAVCYAGSVVWLYERVQAGRTVIGVASLLGCCATLVCAIANAENVHPAWAISNAVTSSLLLGFVMAAMLLGHWYLNSPGMQLQPLQLLIQTSAFSVMLRGLICATGLFLWIQSGSDNTVAFWATIGLRWLAGLVGISVLLWMTNQTLRIPNTQSATGILYVAVIFSFLGELASQLVSAESPYPL